MKNIIAILIITATLMSCSSQRSAQYRTWKYNTQSKEDKKAKKITRIVVIGVFIGVVSWLTVSDEINTQRKP